MLKSRFNLKTFSDSKEDVVEEAAKKMPEKPQRPHRGRTVVEGVEEALEEATVVAEESHYPDGASVAHEDLETPMSPVIKIIRKLHKSEISIRLSMIGKIAEGDGFSYLKATCTSMKLTDVTSLKCFKYLQFVNVSNNFLTLSALQPVMDLPHLILLQADANLLGSANLKKSKFLQVLMLNHNHIKSVFEVFHPSLTTLEVGFNRIEEVSFKNRMTELKSLNLRNNLISSITNFQFAHLSNLFLAENHIKSLVGVENITNLKVLHVRHNPIKNLDGFTASLSKLQYLNLRNCKVSTLHQLRKLRELPALETLVIKGCPFMGGTGEELPKKDVPEDDPAVRIEVIAALIRLKRLNKHNVTPDERTEAKELLKQWVEDDEKDEEEEVLEEQEQESVEISENSEQN